jgi:hypothetical protein
VAPLGQVRTVAAARRLLVLVKAVAQPLGWALGCCPQVMGMARLQWAFVKVVVPRG